MQITTIGIDLAKNVFQVHGANEREKAVLRKQLRPRASLGILRQPPGVPDRDGGLRQRTPLGSQVAGAWAYGPIDGTAVCETLCEKQQKRTGRCASHLPACDAADDAVRFDQKHRQL
jgi:hypothetical protein